MDFRDDYAWEINPPGVRFWGEAAGRALPFFVGQMAINDWCETDDSRDDAISNFERNRKTIESIAWQLLNDNATMSERGVYEIRGQDLERHQPEPRN